MDNDGTRSMNITVQAHDERGRQLPEREKQENPRQIALEDLLAAAYARGDEGDSLKNEETEKTR